MGKRGSNTIRLTSVTGSDFHVISAISITVPPYPYMNVIHGVEGQNQIQHPPIFMTESPKISLKKKSHLV